MYGEEAGYISADKENLSEDHNAMIDKKVQEIVVESEERVRILLQSKERQMRNLSVDLYKYDYVDSDDINKIMNGKKLDKEKVREFDSSI